MMQTKLDKMLKQAQTEFTRGNYDEVKRLVPEILGQLDPLDEDDDNIAFRAKVILLFSQALWKQGYYEKTIAAVSDAFERVGRISDDNPVKNVLLAKFYNMRGLACWKLANYSEAVNNYAATLDICERIGEKMGIAIATGNIGIIYSDLGDNNHAKEYYTQALAIHKELGNEHETAEITCNLGVVLHRTHDYIPSLSYFLEAMSIFEKLGNRAEVARIMVNIGNYYLHLEEYDKVLASLTPALAVYEELDMQSDISVVKGLLGILYATKEFAGYAPQVAKPYLLEAIETDKKIGAKLNLIESYKLLAKIYRNEENWPEYIRHFETFLDLERKTRNEESVKMAQRFALERETAVMQREKEILELKNKELAELNERLNVKNKRLREIDEEKNEFLGIVSHDLKNPLSSITMIAHVLANEANTLTSQEIHEFADDIRSSSARMFQLITDLLDINKIESGITITDKQDIRADVIVRETAAHYRETALNKGITISEQLAPAQVNSSPSVIAQIVDNLVSNAVKYSFPNTEITLKTEADARCVRISIADQGPGLTDEDKRNIFGKFKRLSAQPTGGEHSTGLGLSIVKKLAESIGGGIRYESELGKGTTFTVELPT